MGYPASTNSSTLLQVTILDRPFEMEITLPKTINSTITKSNGKEIRVIKKTKRNINSVDVVLPDGCVAENNEHGMMGNQQKMNRLITMI